VSLLGVCVVYTMAKYMKKRRAAKSYRSGIVSARKKGLPMTKALRKEIADIAKISTEQMAEKKDFGDVSTDSMAATGIKCNMNGGTYNQFACIPPIWLGTAAFQRVGSQVRIHDFKLRVSGFVDMTQQILKEYPLGILLDIRVFSVKGYKNAQAYSSGMAVAEFNTAIESYMYNPYVVQTGSATIGQYKQISGELFDDFCQVNKDSVTEHYKKTIVLETAMARGDPNNTLDADYFRVQQKRSTFQQTINLAPFVAKTWKYDPQPSSTFVNQAARYPNNALVFVVTTFRNPITLYAANDTYPVGYVKYCTKGTFSDF